MAVFHQGVPPCLPPSTLHTNSAWAAHQCSYPSGYGGGPEIHCDLHAQVRVLLSTILSKRRPHSKSSCLVGATLLPLHPFTPSPTPMTHVCHLRQINVAAKRFSHNTCYMLLFPSSGEGMTTTPPPLLLMMRKAVLFHVDHHMSELCCPNLTQVLRGVWLAALELPLPLLLHRQLDQPLRHLNQPCRNGQGTL